MPDEPVVFEPKKVPTKVKHWILEQCLSGWGGIIVNSNLGEIRLCFVDTCCGSGLYRSSDKAEAAAGIYEQGSALIGPEMVIRSARYARERNRAVKTRALLINADRKELETAQGVISSAGLDREIDQLRFENKELEQAQKLVRDFTDNWFSFVFIDPYGPKPTPFAVVADIARGKHTDTLINFPFLSFQKWTGFLDRETTAGERAKLEAADAFMGGSEWRDVARQSKGQLASALVSHYMEQLMKRGVYALALPLEFEWANRPIYHLVFTSHNIAAVSSAKAQFVAAEDQQYRLRQEAETQRTGQGSILFPDSLPTARREIDIEALAADLRAHFSGRTVKVADVILEGLTRSYVLESDVRKALTKLKRSGGARFDATKYRDPVTFVVRK